MDKDCDFEYSYPDVGHLFIKHLVEQLKKDLDTLKPSTKVFNEIILNEHHDMHSKYEIMKNAYMLAMKTTIKNLENVKPNQNTLTSEDDKTSNDITIHIEI